MGGHACAVARAGKGTPKLLCVQGRGGVRRRTCGGGHACAVARAGEGTPALLCVQGRGGASSCVFGRWGKPWNVPGAAYAVWSAQIVS